MSWLSVRAHASAAERDTVMRVLFEVGSQGVLEDGDYLVTHFPPEITRNSVEGALQNAGFTGSVVFGEAEQVNWAERWKDFVKPQVVGDFFVCPPWLAAAAPPHTRVISIEPGMAFGTGDHASTRCALQLLQRVLKNSNNSVNRVADLGAGSGVLSIAAAMLGVPHVVAMENDPDAISNAVANVQNNGVADAVMVMEGDAAQLLPLVAPLDMVAANIISSVLVVLLPHIRSTLSSGGIAVLSGIIIEEERDFRGILLREGWSVVDEYFEEGWCALAITRA